jgi:PLP dependent protein
MSSIGQKIAAIKNELPPNVTLVAVSKTKPNEAILEAYQSGQKQFGENKVQELVAKYEALPKDIEWHLIGHLQSNKVKYIAPFVALIHAVDSLKLLKEIDKQAEKNNRVIDCLLQFHIAKEDTKFGLDMNEANELLSSHEYQSIKNIRVVGVMGMATFTENTEQIAHEFTQLKSTFDGLKNTFFKDQQTFKEVSMGMSGDYKVAVQCGSTMVRIGSTIFGER